MGSLEEALDLTEQMYAAALQSAWEELDGLQQRQSALLNLLLPNTDSIEDADKIRRIKELTDQVVELVEQCRLELGKQLIQIKKGGDVKNAYMENVSR